MLIWRGMSPVFILFNLFNRRRLRGRRRRPGPILLAVAPSTIFASLGGRATSPFGASASAPAVPVATVVAVFVPIITAAGAAGAFAVTVTGAASSGRRTAIEAPNRRGRILSPLYAQAGSFKVSSMHIVISVLSIALATKLDEGVTACSG
jgi:hypothetical protein